MPSPPTDDRDHALLLPALLGVILGHVLRGRRHGRSLEPAKILAAALVTARPASHVGGWLADETDVADTDAAVRAALAFGAGLALVYASDALRGNLPGLSRHGT